MADRVGYKRTDVDKKKRAQIFFEKTLPGASIDDKYIDLLKRGDDRSSDPENSPCSFLTGLQINPQEYRLRLVNTDHLVKSGYIVCDLSQSHSEPGDYSEIYLMKINSTYQDIDLPTRVGYVLERVVHSDPCHLFTGTERKTTGNQTNNSGNYTAPRERPKTTGSRWA